jgi:hypothetical protein
MSTEKDGTEVPPPLDVAEDETFDDVTHVKPLQPPPPGPGALPGSAPGSADDARVRLEALAEQLDRRPTPPPPIEPGDGLESGDEVEAETLGDDELVEEVSDEEVLEADLEEPPAVAAAPPALAALDRAIVDAERMLGEEAHLRLSALYERELEALAKGEPDKARTALYQHEIGELTETGAGDEGAAVKAYAKALQSDATLKPNLWAIGRVFERRALWPNLQKLLDAEIRFARTPEEKAELLTEKGVLLEERLDDAGGALECYQKAVEASPQALAAWMALERIFAQQQDLASLARVYRGMADATAEPARKVALLIDLARLQDSLQGGGPVEAHALLREALAVGVDAERVLDELERLSEQGGGDDMVALLDERATRLQERAAGQPIDQRLRAAERLVAIRRRQAQLARLRGEDERAWAALQSALQIAPGEALVVRELSELAEVLGRWDELADLLAARVEAAPPTRKAALRLERAEALRRAGKYAEADAVEAEVARDEPGHLGLLVSRERAALAARDWERLAPLWLAEAELANSDGTPTGTPDPLWAATALVQAAAALADHLGRDTEAHKALGDALTLVSHFVPAVDALERLYARTGRHFEYAVLLESELENSPTPARAERLYEALIGEREALDDAAGAAQAARRLVTLRPDDVRLRVRLYDLDRAAQKLNEASDDLSELAALLPEDRRVDALLDRADLLEHRLGDSIGAAAAYREVLGLRPGDARAAQAFESLSRRRAKDSGPHEAPSPQAWDDLASALRREAQSSLSQERISHALLKLGEIHERERHNFGDAAQAYRDLLDRAPGQAAALRGLQRAQRGLGDDAGRAEAMEQEAEALPLESRGELLVQLGELFEDVLAQPDRADDAYSRALEAQPTAHAALGKLRTAVRAREPGAIAEAIGRLDGYVGADADPKAAATARAVILDERSELGRLAGNEDAVAQLATAALALDPQSRLPWRMRARLTARALEAPALADALAALAERAADPALQSALARRAGLLALASSATEATDGQTPPPPTTVHERLRQAHALTPSDSAALVALCDVVVDPDALGARARLAEGPAHLDWLIEQAEALEAVGRIGDAAQATSRALELDGKCLPALELARRLARAGGDDKSYAAATARLAGEILEGERAASIYREAALAFERGGARKEAAAAWRAVLDRTPLDGQAFNQARDLMQALHREESAPGPLVELYTHRLAHVREAADRARLLLERSQLLEDEGDRDHAGEDLRAVLALDPAQPDALRRLGELLAATPAGREESIVLIARYLEDEQDRERRRVGLLRLSELQEAAGRGDEAVQLLEQAITLAPTPVESRGEHEKLAQLLVRQRHWQLAVEVLRRLAELFPVGSERAAVEIRVATIYREGFADPRAAVEALLRALRADPLSMEALGKLMPLADAGHVLPIELEEKLERAIDEARGQALAAPLSVEPYAALTRLWGWRGDDDARLVAAQAEALMGGRVAPAREHGNEPLKELSAQAWDRVWPEAARSVALEVWRAVGEATWSVYGPSLESLNVGKRERVNAKGTPLAWIPVDKIARSLLGTQSGYDLYASPRPDVCVAAGQALVMGGLFADKLTAAARFRVARRIALMRERLGPVEALDADEVALFFAACARLAELPRPPSLPPLNESRVEDRARVLGKAIARKDRKALQSIGARMATLPPPGEWRDAVLEGAARAALAVSGDLPSALVELALKLERDPLAQTLTLFAISDDFRVLRREMGLKG